MKNTLNKILGVVLTLAVLSGLIMAVPVSVSAADLSWTNVKMPQVTVDTTANVYAVAEDGKTIYMFSNGTDLGLLAVPPVAPTGVYNSLLYKSIDAGYTWITTGLDTGTVKLAGKIIKFLAIDPANSSNLLAATATNVFRSTNGGLTFSSYDPTTLPGGGIVTSISLVTTSNGLNYLVSYLGGGVAYYNPAEGAWFTTWVTSGNILGTANKWGTTVNAYAAAFSPNFESDGAIIAVAGTSGTTLTVRTLMLNAGNDWGADAVDVAITSTGTPMTFTAADTLVSLAFPSNFSTTSSTYRAFVGIGATNGANTTGLYRVNPYTSNANKAVSLDTPNVYSLSYKGASSGTLAVGQINSKDVMIYTNAVTATSSSITSTSSADGKSPTGGATPKVSVVFSPVDGDANLFAGTEGAYSALSVSTDYASFSPISFIKVSAFANVDLSNYVSPGNPGAAIQYATLDDTQGTRGATQGGDDVYMLFQSLDSGATWKEIFSNNIYTTPIVSFTVSATSTYATDKTIYLNTASPFAPQKKFWKSTDGGATWGSVYTVNSILATSMSVIDANSYWIGSAAGIRNSSTTTTALLEGGETPFVMIPIPGFFVVYTLEGETYVSTDMGASFIKTGCKNITAKGTAFDVPSKTLYLLDSSYNLQKYVVGTSTAWSIYKSLALPPSLTTTGVGSISLTDGVWYFGSSNTTDSQIYQSTDLKTFKAIPGSGLDGAITARGIQFVVSPGATGHTLYTQSTSTATSPTNKYTAKVWTYTNTLISGPKIITPVEGSTVGNSVNISNANVDAVDFNWNAMTNATEYTWELAYDADFTNPASTLNTGTVLPTTNGTSLTAIYLLAGKTYYVRVKVSLPLDSKWSTPVKFNTMITSDVNQGINAVGRISPDNGASSVVLQPAITWGAVTGATYDFKLATDAAFTQIVESKDGMTTTVFSPAQALKANTTYFWEVRAVAGTNVGTWVQSAFTTQTPAAPVVTGTQPTGAAPIITVQPPAITIVPPAVTVNPPVVTVNSNPPETPAYIWVIIAVGAILVIAVIVLIARTRRV